MFTGLIEEQGTIAVITDINGGLEITIECSTIMNGLAIDDSVSIEGVCQTVIKRSESTFTVQAIEETLKKTTFGKLQLGMNVNLERAMLPTARMGGHIVQGHVDCVGTVDSVTELGTSHEIWISYPPEFAPYVVPVGSICVNGISLTVADVGNNRCKVAIIPHTWHVTTISSLQAGTHVNLEFDIIGKYVYSMLKAHLPK